METAQHVLAIGRDGAAFGDIAAAADLTAPVPSCPGWSIGDLVWHLAEVHSFWATIVGERLQSIGEDRRVERVPDDLLVDTYRMQLARLVEVLTDADPDTPVWTWSADHSVAFVARRMAQETAVHRWDVARSVSGDDVPGIEPALASDGIDEFLMHFADDVAEGSEPVGGSVHIHCGDVAGEWTLRPRDGGYDVTREHAKGDCALRGAASDLLLALWRRVGTDAIDVVGDAQVAARFLAAADLS